MARPKIRGLLHDHIDGSLAVMDVIDELYEMSGLKFPFPTVQDWLNYFQNPQENLVEKFDTVTRALQTKEALERLGYAYGKRRAAEGYKYVEAKFAPQYSTRAEQLRIPKRKSLTLFEATEAMLIGLWKAGNDFRIRIHPCVCIGREAEPELGVQIAKICLGFGGEVSMGLACDEANHPPEKHKPAYDLTYGTCVKRDCHAGEWVAPEPAATYQERLLRNVTTAVYDLKVDRVGHAIPLIRDRILVHRLAERGIGVGGAPAAYLAAGLISDIRELGIPELLNAGVGYTLNPDDDLFLPDMTAEVLACQQIGLTDTHWQQLADNVFKFAFAKDARKYLDDEVVQTEEA
jgi:adenosine deaminase